MLYYILNWLEKEYELPGFGVFQYITFRSVLAAIFSLIISLIIGKYIIKILKKKLIGESIREDGPASHFSKKGTPTMGGIIIITAIIIPSILWGNLTNPFFILIITSTIWMGLIGFLDDYIKVHKKNKKGLKARFKIFGQITLGLIIGSVMIFNEKIKERIPRVHNNELVHVNEFLAQQGFESKDRILKVNQQNIEDYVQNKGQKEVSSYVIERYSPKNINKVIIKLITIEQNQRQKVEAEIFGYSDQYASTKTNLPFFKFYEFDYKKLIFWSNDPIWINILYVGIVIFIVTAVSNGVNITDGLDGLAAGTSAIVMIALGIFAYVSGNIIFADYLKITFIPLSGELLIFCASFIGACVGFLWYNTFPAQVFMGDTGSLALGGAIGTLALLVKKELLLPLICGIFFLESLSVIIQVAYFKFTKRKYGEGKRLFKMSPIHHHFELSGWSEPKIVTRFWIITILLEIIAFSTLKLR